MISLTKQTNERHIRSHDPGNQMVVFCVHILGCVHWRSTCSVV